MARSVLCRGASRCNVVTGIDAAQTMTARVATWVICGACKGRGWLPPLTATTGTQPCWYCRGKGGHWL